jgi:hypothetical protein
MIPVQHVKFEVDKMAIVHVFLRVLRLSPVHILPPMFHTHSLTYMLYVPKDKGANFGKLPRSSALSEIRKQ